MKRKFFAFLGAVALFFLLGLSSAAVRPTSERVADVIMWSAFVVPLVLLFFGFRKPKEQRLLERQQWEAAEWRRQGELRILEMLDAALADGRLTQDEVNAIVNWSQANGVPLDGPGGWKLRQAVYLQTLLNGERCPAPVPAPDGIAWEPGEVFIYAWPQVSIAEYQTQKQYVAGSAGVSVRVCKGVYVRSGGTRGHVETSKGLSSLGVGAVAVTNRNIYVMAPVEPIKAPLKKLVSAKALRNGVVLNFSGRQKMLALDAGDHWFMTNVILNARNVA